MCTHTVCKRRMVLCGQILPNPNQTGTIAFYVCMSQLSSATLCAYVCAMTLLVSAMGYIKPFSSLTSPREAWNPLEACAITTFQAAQQSHASGYPSIPDAFCWSADSFGPIRRMQNLTVVGRILLLRVCVCGQHVLNALWTMVFLVPLSAFVSFAALYIRIGKSIS